MTRHPAFGLALATFGALVLTPDAMLLRLSGMAGMQMVGWRGMLMGTALLTIWMITSRHRRADLAVLGGAAGLTVLVCQFFNSTLFVLGVAKAPVAIVLFGVATTPIFAALFARVLLGERTARATWVTIAFVASGIGIAVLGGGEGGAAPLGSEIFGALMGLGVAAVLALNFVMLRAHPHLPIPLLIGLGAICAGTVGVTVTGPGNMLEGTLWAMALTGAIVLPTTFLALSIASRHTAATNVSLLLLLETVLGPAWVWLALGEMMTPAMLLGGAIVVGAIALYLLQIRHRARRGIAKATELGVK